MAFPMPTPPPGFDPSAPGGVMHSPLPVFMVPRSWTSPRLSLVAVGVLARVSALEGEQSINLVDMVGGDYATAETVHDELAAAGILVGGEFVDPAQPKPCEDAGAPVPRNALRPVGVVYYLRRSDGAIKIGHSGQLQTRLRRLEEVYGPLEVLATEPGAWAEERRRQREFERFNLPRDKRLEGGSEWYRPERALLRHIKSLAVSA